MYLYIVKKICTRHRKRKFYIYLFFFLSKTEFLSLFRNNMPNIVRHVLSKWIWNVRKNKLKLSCAPNTLCNYMLWLPFKNLKTQIYLFSTNWIYYSSIRRRDICGYHIFHYFWYSSIPLFLFLFLFILFLWVLLPYIVIYSNIFD